MSGLTKDSSSNTSFAVVITISLMALAFGAAVRTVSVRGDVADRAVSVVVAD